MLKQQTTPLKSLHHPLFEQQNIQVFVKREELNHPLIQGNKLYKLELNLKAHLNGDKKFLLTFGGAYSNHLAATAAACHALQIPSIGVVRGQELYPSPAKWSHTLRQAQDNGMQLLFVNRSDYRLKQQTNFIDKLFDDYAEQFAASRLSVLQNAWRQGQISLLPEGGSNDLAVQGFLPLCQELQQQCPDWSDLFCAVGTGATLAGLVANSVYQENRRLYGVAVLQQSDYLLAQIAQWISDNREVAPVNRWQLLSEYHQGGYAKISKELQNFIDQTWHEIESENAIRIEPIYTAKTFYAFWQKVLKKEFRAGAKIILLHSGGLQGFPKETQVRSEVPKQGREA